jgi:hypothetical protein
VRFSRRSVFASFFRLSSCIFSGKAGLRIGPSAGIACGNAVTRRYFRKNIFVVFARILFGFQNNFSVSCVIFA